MFFIILKNYIKSWFESIGSSKNIRRVKHKFNVGGYFLYVDLFCSFPNSYKWNIIDIIFHYENTLILEDDKWNLKTYLDVMINSNEADYKTLQDFIEVVILSNISSRFQIYTYINKLEIKSPSDIRNDKLNKLLV